MSLSVPIEKTSRTQLLVTRLCLKNNLNRIEPIFRVIPSEVGKGSYHREIKRSSCDEGLHVAKISSGFTTMDFVLLGFPSGRSLPRCEKGTFTTKQLMLSRERLINQNSRAPSVRRSYDVATDVNILDVI